MTGVRPAHLEPGALPGNPLGVLHRLRSSPVRPRPRPGELCELCNAAVADGHGHLVDLESRALLCACRGCYLLFTAGGSGGLRFRSVPERFVSFPDVALSPAEWDDLQIPVSVAFFFVNSVLERVAAFYPGPAGATESELALDTWQAIVDRHPALGTVVPDVEAVLVRSQRGSGVELYVVPIDACYALVGELRQLWKGFDGGSQAHAALDRFFDRVRHEARPA